MAHEIEEKKFAVTYTIDYQHRVVVGVKAKDTVSAEEIALNAFSQCTIWDNTPDMPLLFDDYEDIEAETLSFSSEEVAEFPQPDSSVTDIKKKEFAFLACQALLAGEFDSAQAYANKALPDFVATGQEWECGQCGRIYDDADRCLSDDCPSLAGSKPFIAATPKLETVWEVQSDNGCDPFEIIATSSEDAKRDALYALGWTVSSRQD
jgi:hypothetical protein